ncbi:PREDICTED: uncharacterized protein LOC106809271 [Priapulus caudatus]|uniref:Uncharacterized protein LOC106809271 n=1 Tax=Priapulus caudatus TaxID=37621 RepID=A0ABM1E6E8_PRICU|nr:PREDICTED: uncharacterized protein LOC106809271 [Priapulus caudatus]
MATKEAVPHIEIDKWLLSLGMTQYTPMFDRFYGVEALLYLSETDIRGLGVRNGADRARIVSSVVLLRETYLGKGYKTSMPRKNSSSSCSSSSSNSNDSVAEISQQWETSAEDLKAELEAELRLDSNDIRSHAWYHGKITRQRAECLVAHDGDFLIRDCISQPGEYVMTTCVDGKPVHFRVSSAMVGQGHYPRIQYHFEEERFDKLPELVRYYIGNGKPISESCGARISQPVNRTMPLSYYDAKYGVLTKRRASSSYSSFQPKVAAFQNGEASLRAAGGKPLVRRKSLGAIAGLAGSGLSLRREELLPGSSPSPSAGSSPPRPILKVNTRREAMGLQHTASLGRRGKQWKEEEMEEGSGGEEKPGSARRGGSPLLRCYRSLQRSSSLKECGGSLSPAASPSGSPVMGRANLPLSALAAAPHSPLATLNGAPKPGKLTLNGVTPPGLNGATGTVTLTPDSAQQSQAVTPSGSSGQPATPGDGSGQAVTPGDGGGRAATPGGSPFLQHRVIPVRKVALPSFGISRSEKVERVAAGSGGALSTPTTPTSFGGRPMTALSTLVCTQPDLIAAVANVVAPPSCGPLVAPAPNATNSKSLLERLKEKKLAKQQRTETPGGATALSPADLSIETAPRESEGAPPLMRSGSEPLRSPAAATAGVRAFRMPCLGSEPDLYSPPDGAPPKPSLPSPSTVDAALTGARAETTDYADVDYSTAGGGGGGGGGSAKQCEHTCLSLKTAIACRPDPPTRTAAPDPPPREGATVITSQPPPRCRLPYGRARSPERERRQVALPYKRPVVGDKCKEAPPLVGSLLRNKEITNNVNTQKEITNNMNIQKDVMNNVNTQKEITNNVNTQEITNNVNTQEITNNVNTQKEITNNVNTRMENKNNVNTTNVNTHKEIMNNGNPQKEITNNVNTQKETTNKENLKLPLNNNNYYEPRKQQRHLAVPRGDTIALRYSTLKDGEPPSLSLSPAAAPSPRRRYSDTRFSILDTLTPSSENDYADDDGDDSDGGALTPIEMPDASEASRIDAAAFACAFLPADNKPLAPRPMLEVRELLLHATPVKLAQHLTRCDVDAVQSGVPAPRLGLGVTSGLELITLPQGGRMRRDLLERSPRSRSPPSSSQIARLALTWGRLALRHAAAAATFDAKLRPHLKNLTSGGTMGLHDANVSIPFICPLLQLLETTSAGDLIDAAADWDLSMDAVAAHLAGGRVVARQTPVYRSNAATYLGGGGGQVYRDELLQVFRSEMHLRLLFGARGADADRAVRYAKFSLLLTVMSDKLEP